LIQIAIDTMNDSLLTRQAIYDYCQISRQGFFSAVKSRNEYFELIEKIKPKVSTHRATVDAYAGSRTLFNELSIKSEFGIGVSKFEQIMSKEMMTLVRVKTRIITTKSCQRSKDYTNLINGMTVRELNKVIVGDLTYVYLDNRLYYVFSLFDIYSGKLVGCYGSSRMRAVDAAQAFDQYKKLIKHDTFKGTIHHTDGGSQYFSNLYLDLVMSNKMQISVASSCLENGYAEQRNGLLKKHFLPLITGRDEKLFQQGIEHIVSLYNNRKQESLGWLSPLEFEEKWKGVDIELRPVKQLYNFY